MSSSERTADDGEGKPQNTLSDEQGFDIAVPIPTIDVRSSSSTLPTTTVGSSGDLPAAAQPSEGLSVTGPAAPAQVRNNEGGNERDSTKDSSLAATTVGVVSARPAIPGPVSLLVPQPFHQHHHRGSTSSSIGGGMVGTSAGGSFLVSQDSSTFTRSGSRMTAAYVDEESPEGRINDLEGDSSKQPRGQREETSYDDGGGFFNPLDLGNRQTSSDGEGRSSSSSLALDGDHRLVSQEPAAPAVGPMTMSDDTVGGEVRKQCPLLVESAATGVGIGGDRTLSENIEIQRIPTLEERVDSVIQQERENENRASRGRKTEGGNRAAARVSIVETSPLAAEDSLQLGMSKDKSFKNKKQRKMDPSSYFGVKSNYLFQHAKDLRRKKSFLVRFFAVAKPFTLDMEIDWLSKGFPLAPSRYDAGYMDDEVYGEFNRFMFSDLLGSIYVCPLVAASFFFAAAGGLSFSFGMQLYMIVLGVLLCLCMCIGFYLHHFTYQQAWAATALKWLHTVIGSISVLGFAPTLQEGFARCRQKSDLASWIHSSVVTGIDLANDPQEVERQCYRLYPFAASFILVSVLYTLRLSPHRVVGLCCLFVSTHFFSAFWSDRSIPRSPREYGTYLWLVVATVVETMVIASVRHMIKKGQFQAVVKVEQERRTARVRELELDALLCSMLPSSVLQRLMGSNNSNVDDRPLSPPTAPLNLAGGTTSGGEVIYDSVASASVLFSDMVNFTKWSSTRSPGDVVAMLNAICVRLDEEATLLQVEKVKTIGDAYWAACGLPVAIDDHAERLVAFGLRMLIVIQEENAQHPEWSGIDFRVGVSSGPLQGAVLGNQRLSYEVFGSTSRIAEECEKNGKPGQLCISEGTLAACKESGLALSRQVESYKVIRVNENLTYGASIDESWSASYSRDHSSTNVPPTAAVGESTAEAVGLSSSGGVDSKLDNQQQERSASSQMTNENEVTIQLFLISLEQFLNAAADSPVGSQQQSLKNSPIPETMIVTAGGEGEATSHDEGGGGLVSAVGVNTTTSPNLSRASRASGSPGLEDGGLGGLHFPLSLRESAEQSEYYSDGRRKSNLNGGKGSPLLSTAPSHQQSPNPGIVLLTQPDGRTLSRKVSHAGLTRADLVSLLGREKSTQSFSPRGSPQEAYPKDGWTTEMGLDATGRFSQRAELLSRQSSVAMSMKSQQQLHPKPSNPRRAKMAFMSTVYEGFDEEEQEKLRLEERTRSSMEEHYMRERRDFAARRMMKKREQSEMLTLLATPSSRHKRSSSAVGLDKSTISTTSGTSLGTNRTLSHSLLNSAGGDGEGDADGIVEDEESRLLRLRQILKKRRFKWVSLSFEDAVLEARYRNFVRFLNRPQLLVTRYLLVLCELMWIASLFIEGRYSEDYVPIASWLLIGCGVAVHIGATVNSRFNSTTLTSGYEEQRERMARSTSFTDRFTDFCCSSFNETICTQLSGYLFVLAAWLTNDTMLGNDIGHLFGAFTAIFAFGNFVTEWWILSIVKLVWFFGCVPLIWNSLHLDMSLLLWSLQIYFLVLLMYLNERRVRAQFIDAQVAEHFGAEAEIAREEHEALLTDMVPSFIIPELSLWIASGKLVSQSVAKHYNHVVIAFAKLEKPSAERRSELHNTAAQLMSPSGKKPIRHSSFSHGSSASKIPPLGEKKEVVKATEENTISLITDSAIGHTEKHKKSSASSSRSAKWMLREHEVVDFVLRSFIGVEKIKTIGNLVMLAGPFDPPAESRMALSRSVATVLTALRLISEATSFSCAGIHVGQVVGAIQGTSRICFDVFGDAVNVASRCMSTTLSRGSQTGTICMTSSAVRCLLSGAMETLEVDARQETVNDSVGPVSTDAQGGQEEKEDAEFNKELPEPPPQSSSAVVLGPVMAIAPSSTGDEGVSGLAESFWKSPHLTVGLGEPYHPIAKGKGAMTVYQVTKVEPLVHSSEEGLSLPQL